MENGSAKGGDQSAPSPSTARPFEGALWGHLWLAAQLDYFSDIDIWISMSIIKHSDVLGHL